MKKTILVALSLVMLTVLGLAFNVQTISAIGESITLTKSGVLSADYNTITYTYNVTNNSSLSTLTTVYVVDDKFPSQHIAITASLAPKTTASGTAVYTVTDADRTAGSVTNIAVAWATTPNSNSIYSNQATYNVPLPVLPLPELPAGVLFGVGLAGLGTFGIIMHKKSKATSV
jgi:hypothetical protein